MATTATETAVRDTLEELLEAMNEGDRERLRATLSDDSNAVHIGTDPGEWWNSEKLVEELGGGGPSGVKVVADEVTVHPLSDDAAWVVGRGRFVADGREVSVRMSGVATREGDEWTLVHSHASVGVANEKLFD